MILDIGFWIIYPAPFIWIIILLSHIVFNNYLLGDDGDDLLGIILLSLVPAINIALFAALLLIYIGTGIFYIIAYINKINDDKKIKNKKQKKHLKEKPKTQRIKLTPCYICEKKFENNRKTDKFIKPICPSCVKNITGEDLSINNISQYNKPKVWNSDNYYQYKTMGLN